MENSGGSLFIFLIGSRIDFDVNIQHGISNVPIFSPYYFRKFINQARIIKYENHLIETTQIQQRPNSNSNHPSQTLFKANEHFSEIKSSELQFYQTPTSK